MMKSCDFIAMTGLRLNEQQLQAVFHGQGPALVLAGPGSGKTTVIAARAAWLILSGSARPEQLLTMTFNKAAQREMENRFRKQYGERIESRVHFSTFHSFCNRVVRDYERRQGQQMRRIEGDEHEGGGKPAILRAVWQEIHNVRVTDEELELLTTEISRIKNCMIREIKQEDFMTRQIEALYKAYEVHKKKNLLMDFDDMLTYAFAIFQKCPDILNDYRRQYPWIQVDEGQDLSRIQLEILKLLVMHSRNLMMVADDDQSIYGFRGADPEFILDFQRHYDKAEIFRLEKNHRSGSTLVDLTSQFIRGNTKRFDKRYFTENPPCHAPEICRPLDENHQMEQIVRILKEKSGKESVAVLYRNHLSSLILADRLEREGLLFGCRQGRMYFFSHWMVQDVMAIFRFALDQRDDEAFRRFCFRINRYISRVMVDDGSNQMWQTSFIDAILALPEIKPYQRKTLGDLKTEFIRLGRMRPLDALVYIEEEFRYFDSVRDMCSSTGQNFESFYHLFGILKGMAVMETHISGFLQRLTALQEMMDGQRWSASTDITLSTLHASKGLEYDTVIMLDQWQDEIPGNKATELFRKEGSRALIEEERRLFYVGMTRARTSLYLFAPVEKDGIVAPASQFIHESEGCMRASSARGLQEGASVIHRKFGEGIIVAVFEHIPDHPAVEIDFSGKKKRLDFVTCIENGLLKMV